MTWPRRRRWQKVMWHRSHAKEEAVTGIAGLALIVTVTAAAAVAFPAQAGANPPAFQSVAARESRDVVANLRVLDEIASVAAPIATTL
jgi:hypothetical protein